MGMTFRRKKRSSRNDPSRTASSRSRFVAAMIRTSSFRTLVSPTRRLSPSWRKRSSLTCAAWGIVSDLVEKGRAAVGGLEDAGMVPDGPGESPPDVAEQLRFQEALRDRPAIDRLIRLVFSVRIEDDGPGDELLSRPGFPGDQDGARRGGHPLDETKDRFHPLGLGDDVMELGLALDLPAEGHAGLREPHLFGHVADDLDGPDDLARPIPVGPREDLHPEDVPVRQPDVPERAFRLPVLDDVQDDAVLAGLGPAAIGFIAGRADLDPVELLDGLVLEEDLQVPVDHRDGIADGVQHGVEERLSVER